MEQLDEYIDIFELLGDWDQRYEYLIELGEKMPELDDGYKNENNLIKGCMSRVWIVANLDHDRINYLGDSDTAVIKGILALLINLVDGLTVEEIQKLDMDEIFNQLNLNEHLSPNRHLGVYAMFSKMQEKASELLSSPHAA
ncbi:MAG: SufE family protein [Gammaproteobacteria bacterium]|nr:SufE family protein [Gammaproteobacteria bacterium]